MYLRYSVSNSLSIDNLDDLLNYWKVILLWTDLLCISVYRIINKYENTYTSSPLLKIIYVLSSKYFYENANIILSTCCASPGNVK